MRLAQISLWLAAAAFAAAGATFTLAPGLLRLVELAPATPTARSDVRAVFGGLELGIAGALAVCARRPAWRPVGLLLQGLAFGGLALGRLLSLGLDGVPGRITFALWMPELLGATLAVVALRRLRESDGAPAS